MPEKKYERISVRVPLSWKRTCNEKGISISLVCRAALFQALQQSEQVLRSGSKLRSKQQAAALFNSLRPLLVRTVSPDRARLLCDYQLKTMPFRSICMTAAEPAELIVLGNFLDQGEFAEEILQEVYNDGVHRG